MMAFFTPRLQINPLQQEDWSFFLQLHTDVRTMAFMSDVPQLADIRQRFAQRLLPWHTTSLHMLCLTLRLRENQQPVGFVGVNASWFPWRQADVGYALLSSCFGQGYISEALQPVMHFLFAECQFHKLQASVIAGNDASRRVLEKCAFQLEGTRRQQIFLRGQWVDEWLFGCLLSDVGQITA